MQSEPDVRLPFVLLTALAAIVCFSRPEASFCFQWFIFPSAKNPDMPFCFSWSSSIGWLSTLCRNIFQSPVRVLLLSSLALQLAPCFISIGSLALRLLKPSCRGRLLHRHVLSASSLVCLLFVLFEDRNYFAFLLHPWVCWKFDLLKVMLFPILDTTMKQLNPQNVDLHVSIPARDPEVAPSSCACPWFTLRFLGFALQPQRHQLWLDPSCE